MKQELTDHLTLLSFIPFVLFFSLFGGIYIWSFDHVELVYAYYVDFENMVRI